MGEHEPNRILHDAILRAKIKVNSDYNPKIFHQKFIVCEMVNLVLTGSTNFTNTGVPAINLVVAMMKQLPVRDWRDIGRFTFLRP